ncbi:MAG TPA: hypothetical protein VK773_00650 [Acidimicrobiales bacterium]|nr:hypothetical protein [Acidimicrobiales bacterium]
MSGPVIPLTLPRVIDVGVTPVSDAVLPEVPLHSAASAAGAKLNPAEVAVADDAGGLVAPAGAFAAALLLAVRTPPPETADPPEPPSAWAGELHAAAVVEVVVDEVAVPFDLVVVVVVAAVDVVEVEHGTVVALPTAWATPFASVPPPDAPR